MKGKKIWAIVLSICLVVGSLGVTSVMASGETDVAVSVTTDKTALKAGDVITVSADLDRFQSTIASDTDPLLTTMQFDIPYDSDVFEFVEGSLNSGYINTNILGVRHIPDQSLVRVAVVNANKPGTGEIIPGNGIEQTENPYPFFTYQLKVKDTIAETKSVNLNISNAIFGNVYTDAEYTYSQTPAAVTVYTAPKITVNGSETVEASYTQAVTVAASDNSEITVNGEKMTNPCTITSKGEYTIVATNAAGLTAEKTIKIEPVVESIEMKTLPDKTEYVKGATLDVTGGTILAKLSNEETEEVPLTLDMCDVTTFNTPGPQTITVTYGGKTTTFEVEVHDKEVVKVELISGPTDAEIVEGTELDLTGAAIRVTYSDNSVDESIPVTLDMLSGFDNKEVGEQDVLVVYQNVEADKTFTITVVAKSVTNVEITANDVTEVKEGTEFTPSGKITVSYDNGTSDEVSFPSEKAVVDASGVNVEVPDTYEVTITYTDIYGNPHVLKYNVVVTAKVLTGIEVKTKPMNRIVEGKDIDLTKGVLTLSYDNGTTEEISMNQAGVVLSGFNKNTVGTQTVTVTYNGKQATFEIEVYAKSVTRVELVSGPTDTEIIEGTELDLTGAKINVYYDNDTVDQDIPVTLDMLSGFNNKEVGEQHVSVVYQNVKSEQTFTVTVVAKSVTNVEITANDVTEVKEGTEFTPSGKITVSYDNGTSDEVSFPSEKAVVDPSGVNVAVPDTYEVTITYTDIYGNTHVLNYDVVVTAKELIGIEVTAKPMNRIVEGKDIDLTNGVLTLYYDNNTKEEISMNRADVVLSGFNKNIVGTQTVTVTYNGKQATFEIEVYAKSITRVELVSGPIDTEIIEGTELDLTGAKINVYYDNDTVDQDIPVTLDMLSGFDNTKVGEQNVSVVYQNVKADQTFTVTVVAKSVTGVQITDKNDSVKEAHEYVTTGELTVTYDNGTQDVVSFTDASVVTDISAVDTKVPGIYTVTLHYTDIRGNVHDLSYEVTVVEATGIELVPSNLEVTQNTDLKDAGIEFLLTYANGEKETLTFEDVKIAGYDGAKAGKQELTASYEFNGKTFEQKFNVFVLVKSDMDVSLSGGSPDYYLIMSEVGDEQVRQGVLTELNKLSLNISRYSVLDIDLLSKETGLSVETDDILNVTMQIPEGFDTTKRLTVYGVAEDGTLTKLETIVKDGTLTKLETIVKDGTLSFQANLFDQYVLVEEDTEAETTTSGDAGQTETTTAGSSVETGDSAKGIIVLAVVGMTMAGFVLVSRRKVQK